MQNTHWAIGPFALAAALSVSACGGGDTSNGGTGTFSSPDQVAGAVYSYKGLGSGGLSVFADVASAKAASAARPPRSHGFGAKAARPKATTTENCDAGGSVSFTDDTTTLFADDGATVATSCKSSGADGNGTATYTIHGRVADKCTDSSQSASNCNAFSVRLGEGANGSNTLDLSYVSTNTSDRADVTLKSRADIMETSSGSTDTSVTSGTVAFDDRIEGIKGTAVLSNFRSVYTYSSSGNDTERLDGDFTINSNRANCNVGRVTVRTVTALTYRSSDTVVSGEITLTDASGQTARVTANSDGGITVQLPNGTTRTYSESQLEDICS